jgi:hypothetical protein
MDRAGRLAEKLARSCVRERDIVFFRAKGRAESQIDEHKLKSRSDDSCLWSKDQS